MHLGVTFSFTAIFLELIISHVLCVATFWLCVRHILGYRLQYCMQVWLVRFFHEIVGTGICNVLKGLIIKVTLCLEFK
jgi:hypothetical protein